MIKVEESVFLDSIQLYDDGLHGDGAPNDNIFGGAKWYSGLTEDMYLANLSVRDSIEGTSHYLVIPSRFTTIGPVVVHDDSITYHDPTVGFRLTLYLRNDGSVASAENIAAGLSTTDSNVTDISPSLQHFGDIAPQDDFI